MERRVSIKRVHESCRTIMDSWRAILIRFHIKYRIIVAEEKREERKKKDAF